MNPFWGTFVPVHGIQVREIDLLSALSDVFRRSTRGSPEVIMCGAPQYAAIKATIDFQGRDRRRIKREVNKAMRKARRK